MRESKINDYILLRLEGTSTVIYVKGERFNQCKYLLFEIPIDKITSLDRIESIDEIVEKLDRSMDDILSIKPMVPPEVEFWGHCSNLQVWVENNYDTRLLRSNLAFPLLNEMSYH